jgi:hypothetical protein
MAQPAHDTLAAFVGIDWAEANHDMCLQAAGTATREGFHLDHTPEAIDAGVATLRTRFSGQPVAVCLERTTGPRVSALRTDDVLVLFPINPLTLARYRAAFTPSRATDAPTDAALQLELLLTHRDKLPPQSPTIRALAQLVEHRRRVVGDKVRITTRLTSTLKHDCPQVLPWFQAKDTCLVWDFLSHWPTLKAAPLARRSTLETVFRDHHVRSADVIVRRLHVIKAATPLTTDAGVIAANALLVQALGSQLRVPGEAIASFDHAIAQRAHHHPDCPLFQALPGAGSVFAPRRLVAFGEPRDRDASAAELHKYAGIAPVTARSAKKAWGHWRLQCPKCLRPTFVAWAAASIRHACWAQVYYQQQGDKGQAHQAAVRALAFKWRRILSRCWQDRTLYHEAVSLQARHRRGAPLIQNLARGA